MENSEKLFKLNLGLDKWLEQSKQTADKIKDKYDPRTQFNLWRQSQDGKEWKQQKYIAQNFRCAKCGCSMLLEGAHIDHIKPISTHPELNLDTRNLRLVHPLCNLTKGSR